MIRLSIIHSPAGPLTAIDLHDHLCWIHEGNTKQENNGKVAFKLQRKYSQIRQEIGQASLHPPTHRFLKQASGHIFKDNVNGFPPDQIFALWLESSSYHVLFDHASFFCYPSLPKIEWDLLPPL